MNGQGGLRAMVDAEYGDVICKAQAGLPPGKISTQTVTLANGTQALLVIGSEIWDAKNVTP